MAKELVILIQHGIIYLLLLVKNIYNIIKNIRIIFYINKSIYIFIPAFRKPYLFIIHFSSVEIVKLDQEAYTLSTKNPERILIELSSPRYLGVAGLKGIYIATMNSFLELLKIEGSSNIPELNGSLTSLDTLYVIKTYNLIIIQ